MVPPRQHVLDERVPVGGLGRALLLLWPLGQAGRELRELAQELGQVLVDPRPEGACAHLVRVAAKWACLQRDA